MADRLSPTVAPSDWLRRSPRSLARRKERPALHRHRIRAQRRAQLGRDHRRDRAVGTQPTTTFTSVGTALSGANNRAARATPEYQSTAVPRRAYRLDGLGQTGPLPLQIQQSSAARSCLASLAPPQEGGAFSWPTQATPEFQSPRRPEYATKARAIAKSDAYVVSRRERKKTEMLFAQLKRINLDRLRLGRCHQSRRSLGSVSFQNAGPRRARWRDGQTTPP
jgi:hypothetical protein